MQSVINRLSELFIDSGRFGNFFSAGTGQFLQAAEVVEQFAPPLGADTRHFFQCRGTSGLAASRTVPGDRKAVRFVTDLLSAGELPGKVNSCSASFK